MTVQRYQLSDFEIDEAGEAECFHCEEPFPPTAAAHLRGLTVEIHCPKCGCVTLAFLTQVAGK